MKHLNLAHNVRISPIVHGHWRLLNWNLSTPELLTLTEQCIALGITTFDHADIYGNYSCEEAFGRVLQLNKGLRKGLQIVTKCGINLATDKYPDRTTKHYDYSAQHIINSVHNSLKNFNTDFIEVLLLHRPSPFMNLDEIAQAFSLLKKEGKVLQFGVSNFNTTQFETLNSYLDEPLVTNQLELSPYHLKWFENDHLTYLQSKKVRPMAWSPLAGGTLFNPTSDKGFRLLQSLQKTADELEETHLDKVIYSWLLKHPSGIIPVVGSGSIERIKIAVEAFNIPMSLEQWFGIYIASQGKEMP